ncbi:hypothetical protein ACFWCF_24840 [Rhodococcus sp. NPDC060090]|uniref:hypothetical protein n=1 Tax=Rhodococcus sp. NPDC060090 TaxID=3347056 RepID=UPI00364E36BE
MSVEKMREEVALELLEKIRVAAMDPNNADPGSLKTLAETFALVIEAGPKRSPKSGGAFVG